MKRSIAIAVTLAVLVGTASAKTHDYPYPQSCDAVWHAVKYVLVDSGRYTAGFDEENRVATFTSFGAMGGGFRTQARNRVALHAEGTGCTMVVDSGFSGVAHNDAKDFNKRVAAQLH